MKLTPKVIIGNTWNKKGNNFWSKILKFSAYNIN